MGRALPRAIGVPALALGLAQGKACDPSWANGSAASPGPVIGSGRACDPSGANGSDSFSRDRLLTLVILHHPGKSSCLHPGTQERGPLLSSSPPRPRPLAPCFTVLIGNGIRMPPLQGCCWQPPQTQDLSGRVENRAQRDPSPRCLLPAKSCRPLTKWLLLSQNSAPRFQIEAGSPPSL